MRRLPAWLTTGVLTAAILWLTLSPQPLPDADFPLFPGVDKVVHAVMFGAWAFALLFDLTARRTSSLRLMAVAAIAAAAFGALIELAQGTMGLGRSAEWADLLSDALGALLGALLCHHLLSGKRPI